VGRRNRFVKPKTISVPISDGDTIQIKRELTVGERKRMFAAGLKQMSAGGEGEDPKFDIDPVEMSFAKVQEYLVDWSFEEEDDKGDVIPVELSDDAIRNMDQETFEEIETAIDEHVEKLDKEKKAKSGKAKSKQK
jgi:hypothetical protein